MEHTDCEGSQVCSASNHRASPHLRQVVEDALQKHPHRRLASAETMLARIQNVQALQAASKLAHTRGDNMCAVLRLAAHLFVAPGDCAGADGM